MEQKDSPEEEAKRGRRLEPRQLQPRSPCMEQPTRLPRSCRPHRVVAGPPDCFREHCRNSLPGTARELLRSVPSLGGEESPKEANSLSLSCGGQAPGPGPGLSCSQGGAFLFVRSGRVGRGRAAELEYPVSQPVVFHVHSYHGGTLSWVPRGLAVLRVHLGGTGQGPRPRSLGAQSHLLPLLGAEQETQRGKGHTPLAGPWGRVVFLLVCEFLGPPKEEPGTWWLSATEADSVPRRGRGLKLTGRCSSQKIADDPSGRSVCGCFTPSLCVTGPSSVPVSGRVSPCAHLCPDLFAGEVARGIRQGPP